jgi:hypothetical protein
MITIDEGARNYLSTKLGFKNETLSRLSFSRPTTALVTKTRSRIGDNDAGYF